MGLAHGPKPVAAELLPAVGHLDLRPSDRLQLGAGARHRVAQRARVIPSEAVPRGLAIVDSPDLDSVRGENREIAAELLEAADLWIFVTTPSRYGDRLPWDALRAGAERGASIAIVLNRVTPDVAARFATHRSGKGAAFTRSFPPRKVLAAMRCASRGAALSAEHALKQLERSEKLAWARLYEWAPKLPKAARRTRPSRRRARAQSQSS